MSSLFDSTLSLRTFTTLAGMAAASALVGGLAGCASDAGAPANAVPEKPEERGPPPSRHPSQPPMSTPDPEIEPTQEEEPAMNTACAVVYFSVTGTLKWWPTRSRPPWT